MLHRASYIVHVACCTLCVGPMPRWAQHVALCCNAVQHVVATRACSYGRVEDIGLAVVYLSGPAGGFITATTIIVDGGQWHAYARTLARTHSHAGTRSHGLAHSRARSHSRTHAPTRAHARRHGTSGNFQMAKKVIAKKAAKEKDSHKGGVPVAKSKL
jgi:hypothetical protein